ncbi:MAG: ureidoglycolate lyase [Pseudomonadota bacterium]
MDAPERTLLAKALTAEAFAPFGDVISAATAQESFEINEGGCVRFHDLAHVEVEGGRAGVSLFRPTPVSPPFRIQKMERHPLGSQAFVPLHHRDYLVVVAPPGPFDESALTAFHAAGDQGVNYRKGVWHHFLLALHPDTDFLVVDRIGDGDNLEEVEISDSAPIRVGLSGAQL